MSSGIQGACTSAGTSTIDRYASSLHQCGRRLVAGSPGTYWVQYEALAMMRIPTFELSPPRREELDDVLQSGFTGVASYLMMPDLGHPPNAWLYTCTDQAYRLEGLCVAARRDARRALRNLRIDFVDPQTLLEHGYTAFRETRSRVGLSDGTREQFECRFETFFMSPSHCVLGAWKGDELAAFMTLVVVEDWVEIEGSFSANASRTLCPNDGLAHVVLDHFLVGRRFRTISYGLSSIQSAHQMEGLHAYKIKVGFQTIPVHRVFVLHPFLRLLANNWTLSGMKAVEKLFPHNRLMKKAGGVLNAVMADKDVLSIERPT